MQRRSFLAALAALSLALSSCTTIGNHPVTLRELERVRLELQDAQEVTVDPAVGAALGRADAALGEYLAIPDPLSDYRKPLRIEISEALQAALGAVEAVESPPAEVVLARASLRKWAAAPWY